MSLTLLYLRCSSIRKPVSIPTSYPKPSSGLQVATPKTIREDYTTAILVFSSLDKISQEV